MLTYLLLSFLVLLYELALRACPNAAWHVSRDSALLGLDHLVKNHHFTALTLVFGEQTAHAGENAC